MDIIIYNYNILYKHLNQNIEQEQKAIKKFNHIRNQFNNILCLIPSAIEFNLDIDTYLQRFIALNKQIKNIKTKKRLYFNNEKIEFDNNILIKQLNELDGLVALKIDGVLIINNIQLVSDTIVQNDKHEDKYNCILL